MHLVLVVMDTGQVSPEQGALLQRLEPGELAGQHRGGEAPVLPQARARQVVLLPGFCGDEENTGQGVWMSDQEF